MLPRRDFSLTLAGLLAGPAWADPPQWVSGEVPPYLWQGAKGPEGYAFELFQRVTRQADTVAELRFYPWARALLMLQAGQAEAALVMTRTPDREARFRWLFPVGNFRFALATWAREPAPPSDIGALRHRRIGSMRASVSQGMLASAGVNQVVEGKDYAELLTLLQRGFVDSFIGPDAVLRKLDVRHGGSDSLRLTLLDQRAELWSAAGPAMTDDAVQRLRTAYQQLVDGGAVAQLRKRHPDAFFDD